MSPSSPVLALASRSFQTSSKVQDVDSAAKFIGAGAATVGVAGQTIDIFILLESAQPFACSFL